MPLGIPGRRIARRNALLRARDGKLRAFGPVSGLLAWGVGPDVVAVIPHACACGADKAIMGKQIVAVRMDGGEHVRHIGGCALLWKEDDGYKAKTCKVAAVIKEIERGIRYFSCDYLSEIAEVEVVTKQDGTQYIRTVDDGTKNDNLLRLSRYGSE
jgi:Protein of unknown function (DUF3892)